MGYQKIQVPRDGDKMTINADLSLNVPKHRIIPYIEGVVLGTISPVMLNVVNAAVEKPYGNRLGIDILWVFRWH